MTARSILGDINRYGAALAAQECVLDALGADLVLAIAAARAAAQAPPRRGPGHPRGPRVLDHEAVALSIARSRKPGVTVTAIARELRPRDDGFPRRLLFLLKATEAKVDDQAAARRAAAQARLARRHMVRWHRAQLVAAHAAGASPRA